jgi:hypothetical protein
MSWTVVPAADFARHTVRWDTLHAASHGSPLLASEFVAALLTVFGTGAEQLAWYERDGRCQVMTIVAPARFGLWETFQPAQAPVGLWLQCDASAPMHLDSLAGALPGIALAVGVTQCDPMLLARPVDSGALRTLDYIDTARITLASDFDTYWNARGKNLRSNLKKQRNRLRAEGIETRLEILRAPGDMAAAVDDYGRLEGSGWKAVGGTAVGADNEQGRFYRLMLEAFCRRGAGSVYRYWIGDQLAAMDLCVEGGGCVVVLKTAYDERIDKHLSPALLMREEACRALFDEGRFARIEFYGRIMEWHTRWTEEARTMYHLNRYRWPGLARLHAWAKRG